MERGQMIREIIVTLASMPPKTMMECIEYTCDVAKERAARTKQAENKFKELVETLKRMTPARLKEFQQVAALIMDGYAMGYAAAQADTVAALQKLDKRVDDIREVAKNLLAVWPERFGGAAGPAPHLRRGEPAEE